MTEAFSASFRVQEADPEPVPSLSWIPAKSRLVCSSCWSQRLTLLAGRAAVLLKHIWCRGSLNTPHIVFLRLLTLRNLTGMLTRASRICWEFLPSGRFLFPLLSSLCAGCFNWRLYGSSVGTVFLPPFPSAPPSSHFSSLLCWYNYPCVDVLLVPVVWRCFASYF